MQLSPAAVEAMVEEHSFDWRALGVLLALVVLADDRTIKEVLPQKPDFMPPTGYRGLALSVTEYRLLPSFPVPGQSQSCTRRLGPGRP